MDQKSLQSSSRRWMQAAFEAFGRGESLDFAVHHAGVGLEHLLKAYLSSLHPALVIDAALVLPDGTILFVEPAVGDARCWSAGRSGG